MVIWVTSMVFTATVSVKYKVSFPSSRSKSNPSNTGLVSSKVRFVTCTAFAASVVSIALPFISCSVALVKIMKVLSSVVASSEIFLI